MENLSKPLPPTALVKSESLPLLPVAGTIELYFTAERVAVFCYGLCIFTFATEDKFSRNYCLVQLYQSGKFRLKYLAKMFRLNYQHCSKILNRFREFGLEGLKEEVELKRYNRRIIDDEIASMILDGRKKDLGYDEIANQIRFWFKKKISSKSVRNWVSRQNNLSKNEICLQGQLMLDVGQVVFDPAESKEWHRNIYAGSMILYAVLERTNLLKAFEENLREDYSKKHSSSGQRRVILTVFFLHALRLRSIEQSKHLLGKDFCQIIGGSFLRTQSLRYAIDEVIDTEGFDRALEVYFRDLIYLTEKRNRIFYTDGHFSNYYGSQNIPKGYDAKRQMGFKGRTSVYLHNTEGEVMFLFESVANTSLSNDIETLIKELKTKGMRLKRKTLFFDRGGYSAKCFSFLKQNKMYFVTYLKNRKKERRIDERKFTKRIFFIEDERHEYDIYEGDRRWTKSGQMRIIVFIGTDGHQIPIITSNIFLQPETIIYYLQRRWREENCFKYMIEHFGIDLLTSYKTEEAPDKIILKVNPERTGVNRLIANKKVELQKLQSEFANEIIEREVFSAKEDVEFLEEQEKLKIKIKNLKVDIELLLLQRQKISSKVEYNLKENNVIMAQKRRLFLNAIKALNYNSEKWLQKIFIKFHAKEDETLSLIRSLLKHPGQIRENESLVEVVLDPIDSKTMRQTAKKVLDGIDQNRGIRLPDGRLLRLKLTQ